ncbi:hypothetical protein SCRDD08_01972 [Streptococcus cristatus]|uniref:Uncharacterized protein n=1 Tax=Streptococcus cristatus TaxID=45634 RepID=A0A139MY25_STRCR|nr:hypothetical protein SCRDD08_01972 [Streptococcus cristatus]
MAPLSRCRYDLLHFRQGIHSRHIGMGVKFDPLLTLRHQVLTLIVGNGLHILDIHGQVAGEVVHLHIAPHAQPGTFLNHVKLLGFFFVFQPFLQSKAGSVVGHLEVEQDPAGPSDLLLQIKDHALKDQTILLSLNFDHRSNLCLVQIWFSRSLASLEIINRFFFWRWRHLLQGFHGFERLFIGRLNNLVILRLEILRLLLGQLIAVLNLTGQLRKAVFDQLATEIWQVILTKMLRIDCRSALNQQLVPIQMNLQILIQTLEAMTGTRPLLKGQLIISLQEIIRYLRILTMNFKNGLIARLRKLLS